MAIEPVPAGEPMNKVLLVYEYAGSATFSDVGTAVVVENFSWIVVFAIFIPLVGLTLYLYFTVL
jgi:hypothetical protein